MGVSVTFKDLGMDLTFDKMRQLNRLSLSVGVQGRKASATYDDGTTVAMVALYNEFGTSNIPARSFVRGALFQYKAQIEKVIAKSLADYLSKKTQDAVTPLAKIGKFAASRVVARINTPGLWAKPNAPATVRKKGFNRPLHDTGKLAKSITYAVRAGDSSGAIVKEGPG